MLIGCLPIVLAGCQHPMVSSVSEGQPPGLTVALIDVVAPVRCENAIEPAAPSAKEQTRMVNVDAKASPKPQDASLVANAQKPSVSQTCELADGLMLVFKTFTGH